MKQITELRFPNVGEALYIDVRDAESGYFYNMIIKYNDEYLLCSNGTAPQTRGAGFLARTCGFDFESVLPVAATIDEAITQLFSEDRDFRGYSVVTEPMTCSEYSYFGDTDKSVRIEDEDEVSIFYSPRYEGAVYSGMHRWHSHKGAVMNAPTRETPEYYVGVECEVEFREPSERATFNGIDSNWFYRESDGSLSSGVGCEIITVPLAPRDAKDVEFWNPLTDYLSDKADAWDTGRCGLHVHISRTILGKSPREQRMNLGKLLFFYHHYFRPTSLCKQVYGRERGYSEESGKSSMVANIDAIGHDVLAAKEVQEKLCDSLIRINSSSRYRDINILNSKTIEFRKGRGTINPKRIAMVIEFCEKMCMYAKHTPWQDLVFYDFITYLKAVAVSPMLREIIDNY